MRLQAFGWTDFFEERRPDISGMVGRVVRTSREQFLVWTEEGDFEAGVSGRFRHDSPEWPCTGDWVILREKSIIVAMVPRRTKVSRKRPGRQTREQVLAANVDVVFIVSGLDCDYNVRRLERYLLVARESGALPVIVLNKVDLIDDVYARILETQKLAPGVAVVAISALEHHGLEGLSEHVRKTQTAALIGSSGVGKSTIVNRLLGEERQQSFAVRDADSRGRHTTTSRELVLLPQGWLLMDMPGLREVQLWADPDQVDDTFADITALARNCRFRDCSHREEPGCAVRDAEIDGGRLLGFYKLQRELEFLDRQQDVQLALATKKRWKALHKAMRHHPKKQ